MDKYTKSLSDIVPNNDAQSIAGLQLKGERPSDKMGILNPHSPEDYEQIESLAGKHLRLPKNMKMKTAEKLTELFSLLSPNQRYAYYHLKKRGKE